MKKYGDTHGMKDKSLAFVNSSNLGTIGEKKFIVNATWWRTWCDYANFSDNMEFGSNQDLHNVEDGDTTLRRQTLNQPVMYENPGIIQNR